MDQPHTPPADALRTTRFREAESVDEVSFRNAMAGGVQGVAIVTTDGPGGRAGITISSLVSASVEPPLLIVCIRRRGPTLAAIVRNRAFSVSLLTSRHCHLAQAFAGRPEEGPPYDFARATWVGGATGAPLLSDAAAGFDCVLESTGRVGTHQALVGRCIAVREGHGPPLLYTERRYGIPLTWTPRDAAPSDTDPSTGA